MIGKWFLTAVANAAGVATLLPLAGAATFERGLVVAMAAWVGFGASFSAWQVVFAKQPLGVWLLNNGALVLMLSAIVAVLTAGR